MIIKKFILAKLTNLKYWLRFAHTRWLYKKGYNPYQNHIPKHFKFITYWFFSPSMWSFLEDKDMAESIELGIVSPSKLNEEYGCLMVQHFMKGMESEKNGPT